MKPEEMRQKLMQSTIRVVARDGIHKTTTKSISMDSGLNEVYIYRLYQSKEDLFQKTFYALDEELIECVMHYVPIMDDTSIEIGERCRMFFNACWRFLLGDREKCLFFIRYYFSQFFSSYSLEKRKILYGQVLDRFSPAFRKGTDVWMLFNHILDVGFHGILKVLRNEMPDNEETAEITYQLLYHSLRPYLVWSEPVELRQMVG